MTEDSLCGAITWCCWCFCGEMRAGKLSVFVHWIRLRTILARSGGTTITTVPGSCFFLDIPFSSRQPYFFVCKSFIALSLLPPLKEILLCTTGKYPIPESSPFYYSQPHGNSDICSVLHTVYIPFALHFAPLACITICSNKATVRLFFQLSLLVQRKCYFFFKLLMVSQQRIYYSNFLSTLLLVGEQLWDYYTNLYFNIAFRLVAS